MICKGKGCPPPPLQNYVTEFFAEIFVASALAFDFARFRSVSLTLDF